MKKVVIVVIVFCACLLISCESLISDLTDITLMCILRYLLKKQLIAMER